MRIWRMCAIGCLALCSCTVTDRAAEPVATGADPAVTRLPPGGVDYQLGGSYEPPAAAVIVARDWFEGEHPGPGRYGICYVNAFQTQPAGDDPARGDGPEGWPADVVLSQLEDPAWAGELVIDISTSERRATALAHVVPMLDVCAAKGFEAVEFDNLDTFQRYDLLPFGIDDTIVYAAALADEVHERGMAVGQKNTVELTAEQSLDIIGFDFAVVEECGEFDECAAYASVFGDQIIAIEYTDGGFREACDQLPGAAVVRRDLLLSTPNNPEYVYATCDGR